MLKIYLETTIFNFPFANDAPQYRDTTLKLFEEIKTGTFKAYTSDFTIRELKDASKNKKIKMLELIREFDVEIFRTKHLAFELAKQYVDKGIIPQRYKTDATHIATASVFGIPIIVSLNFRHIVKVKTKIMCSAINALYGLESPIICTPEEVIRYEKEIHL